MSDFHFQEIFELGEQPYPYRRLSSDYVSTARLDGREILLVDPQALTLLARAALDDVSHLLRPGHLAQLRAILDDPEASDNDRFVAMELLANACVAAGRELLTEPEAKSVLVAYEIPTVETRVAETPADCARLALEMKRPLAVKIV